MSRITRIRILLGVAAIAAILIIIADSSNRNTSTPPVNETDAPAAVVNDAPAPTISLYVNDTLLTTFEPTELESLSAYGFEDAVESKLQSGPLLRDVVQFFVTDTIGDDWTVTVSSTTRDKSVTMTWAEVANPDNFVLFDPSSNRGTWKLVSRSIEDLDTRNEWIQDTDRIDINQP